MEEHFSTESIVMMVCAAAIGTLFTACSAGLGWLLNRGVKQIDELSRGHVKLKDDHAELRIEQVRITEKVNGHAAWLQDHEQQINELRQAGA